jgi:hypothetical protein
VADLRENESKLSPAELIVQRCCQVIKKPRHVETPFFLLPGHEKAKGCGHHTAIWTSLVSERKNKLQSSWRSVYVFLLPGHQKADGSGGHDSGGLRVLSFVTFIGPVSPCPHFTLGPSATRWAFTLVDLRERLAQLIHSQFKPLENVEYLFRAR